MIDYSICSIYSIDSEDSWLKSAIEVFDHIPNGHKTTFDYSVGLNPGEYKLALYR